MERLIASDKRVGEGEGKEAKRVDRYTQVKLDFLFAFVSFALYSDLRIAITDWLMRHIDADEETASGSASPSAKKRFEVRSFDFAQPSDVCILSCPISTSQFKPQESSPQLGLRPKAVLREPVVNNSFSLQKLERSQRAWHCFDLLSLVHLEFAVALFYY